MEKVKLQRYVHEYIEKQKRMNFNKPEIIWTVIAGYFDDSELDDKVDKWLEIEGNDELLMKALVNGYEIEEESTELCIPELNEKYYFLRPDGEVLSRIWKYSHGDMRMCKLGNVFKTREAAEFEAERIKVYHEMKLYARPFKPEENNFYLMWNWKTNTFQTYNDYNLIHRTLYFDSEQHAEQVVSIIGEDRVKKYYLGVE